MGIRYRADKIHYEEDCDEIYCKEYPELSKLIELIAQQIIDNSGGIYKREQLKFSLLYPKSPNLSDNAFQIIVRISDDLKDVKDHLAIDQDHISNLES